MGRAAWAAIGWSLDARTAVAAREVERVEAVALIDDSMMWGAPAHVCVWFALRRRCVLLSDWTVGSRRAGSSSASCTVGVSASLVELEPGCSTHRHR
jgi:hypothetical protein